MSFSITFGIVPFKGIERNVGIFNAMDEFFKPIKFSFEVDAKLVLGHKINNQMNCKDSNEYHEILEQVEVSVQSIMGRCD